MEGEQQTIHSECNEGKVPKNEIPSQLLPIYQDMFLTFM